MRNLNTQMSDAIIVIVENGHANGSIRNVGSSRVVAYGVRELAGRNNRWLRAADSDASAQEVARSYAETTLAGLESAY